MADLGQSIDTDSIVVERSSFDPMPAGQYLVQIIDSDVVKTNAGTGTILKLTFEVMSGPYENRKIWANLNYQNPSPEAQRIAQEQIKQICDAIGFTGQLSNSEDLHYQPMMGRVVVKKDDTYGDKNELKGFKPAQSAPPAGKAPPQGGSGPAQQGSSARPATPGKRPWEKSAA